MLLNFRVANHRSMRQIWGSRSAARSRYYWTRRSCGGGTEGEFSRAYSLSWKKRDHGRWSAPGSAIAGAPE
jgi:hypothetical protein